MTDLDELRDRLQALQDRFGSSTLPVLVPDTNTFIHYTFFNEANWPELAGGRRVRIVVPLVVVEELDQLKFSRDDRVSRHV